MENALVSTSLPGIPIYARGKVRDVYDLGDRLLIVATDRISAFDCIMPNGIPGKGKILTEMSLFWFGLVGDIVPNHLITARVDEYPPELRAFRDQLDGRSMIVRKASRIDVECIVRGYLSGSGWKEYRRNGTVCGIPLPAGLAESDRLPHTIFTPSTKADSAMTRTWISIRSRKWSVRMSLKNSASCPSPYTRRRGPTPGRGGSSSPTRNRVRVRRWRNHPHR